MPVPGAPAAQGLVSCFPGASDVGLCHWERGQPCITWCVPPPATSSHQSGAKGQNRFPRPAGHVSLDSAQDTVGFLGYLRGNTSHTAYVTSCEPRAPQGYASSRSGGDPAVVPAEIQPPHPVPAQPGTPSPERTIAAAGRAQVSHLIAGLGSCQAREITALLTAAWHKPAS